MSIYRGRSCRDVYLASLVYDAIDDNNIKSVKVLLEKGADPNLVLPRKGISSFHRIIGCDSLDFTMKATRLVLQFDGNPNVRSDDGLTPVHIAAAWGRSEVLQILLNSGGDPEAKDSNYMTPIDYAIKEDFSDCISLLKSFLPDITLYTNDQEVHYSKKLDKILVNNGIAVGEYYFPHDVGHFQKHTYEKCLSKDNISEYVMNWFDKCEKEIENITSFVSTDNDFFESTTPLRRPQRRVKEGSISINPPASSVESGLATFPDKSVPNLLQEVKLSSESGIVVSPNEHHIVTPNCNVDKLNKRITACDLQEFCERRSGYSGESNYITCSNSELEKNIFEQSEDLFDSSTNILPSGVNMNDSSFLAISEIYKYEDKDEGIVLFERRLVKTPTEYGGSIKSGSVSSKMSSLPDAFEYDTDTLKKELTSLGFVPGPITKTTKTVYLKKLYRLKKQPIVSVSDSHPDIKQKVFSVELEKTRKNFDSFSDLTMYKSLEEIIIKEFSSTNSSKKWREGLNKSSFTYLLLDPRVTVNLPFRYESLEPKEVWDIFLSSVFYIGKGKKTRPYSHLYDAVALWKSGKNNSDNSKLQFILDIWKNDCGVICLHVFHNVIPVEAYTREAAMIAALKLENLTNSKSGEFYGIAASWPQRNKKSLGVYLLYKAMKIFLQDGERQIYPRDIE